jgi:hypothetical protein
LKPGALLAVVGERDLEEDPMPRHALVRAALVLPLAFGLAAAAHADSGWRLERQLALQPGGELQVDVSGGGVTVTGGAESGAAVLVTADRDVTDRFTFELSGDGQHARILSKRKGGWSWFSFGSSEGLHFEVRVPRQTRVDVKSSGGGVQVANLEGKAIVRSSGGGLKALDVVGDIDLDTSGGGITIERVHGNARLDTSGGSIHVRSVIGNVGADTSGGGIEVDGVTGDLNATTSGGGVHVTDVGGRLNAESSGGPVSATLRTVMPAGGKLSSSGGGVSLEVAPTARFTVDASSSGGSVQCDLPVVAHHVSRTELKGDVNGGGPVLRLESSGGGVHIGTAG